MKKPARNLLEKYTLLLEEYYELIWGENWWDGKRDKLVAKMLPLLEKMTYLEKDSVMQISRRLYEKYQCRSIKGTNWSSTERSMLGSCKQ